MKKTASLANLLADFVSGLPREAGSTTPNFTFDKREIPVPPERVSCDQIAITSRQIYRGNGMIDNLRIRVTKESSTLLGCWILAGHLRGNGETYVIELPASDGGVSEIQMPTSERFLCGVEVTAARFVWSPGFKMAERCGAGTFLGEQGEIHVADEEGEWDRDIEQRHVLKGFGRLGGACRVASFFLDFGLQSSGVNYDYLKDDNHSSIVSTDSCEARVELWDAFDKGVMWRKVLRH